MSKGTKAAIAIIGGGICGALGVAALVYPDQAVIFASASGTVAVLVGVFTGIQIIKGA